MQALAASVPAPAQALLAISTASSCLQRFRGHGCHAFSPSLPCRLRSIDQIKGPLGRQYAAGGRQNFQVVAAQSSVKLEKWLLEPIGDGDCSHLDEAVPLPGAFQLSTDAATVGRVSEKADIVIPVVTVSGLHARLEKKNGTLFVTDLDSTNGTYVNDRQIRPGAVTPVPPGSRITFGDDHLAAFKFSKVEEEIQSE